MKSFFTLVLLTLTTITFAQNRNVLIEKHSATWCGYCPAAAIEMDSLMDVNPNIIGISVHYNDIMQTPDSKVVTEAYVEAFPGSTLDRTKFDSEAKLNVFYQNWDPLIEERLNTPSPIELSGTAVFETTTREMTIVVNGNFVSNYNGDVRLNAYILEDSVTGGSNYNQRNYYFNNDPSHPYLYQAGDPILNYVHNHVLRILAGGPWGQTGFNGNHAAGQTINHTFKVDIPANYRADHMEIVLVAQAYDSNINDREILNAKRVALNSTTSIDKIAESPLRIYPNPSQGVIHLAGIQFSSDMEITLFDMLGRTVYSNGVYSTNPIYTLDIPENINAGNYILEVKGKDRVYRKEISIN